MKVDVGGLEKFESSDFIVNDISETMTMICNILSLVVNIIVLATFVEITHAVAQFFFGCVLTDYKWWEYVAMASSWFDITAEKQYAPMILACLIMLGVLLFGLIKPIMKFIYWFQNLYRDPTPEENNILLPLFNELCEKSGKNPADFNLYVNSENVYNAFAFGENNICMDEKTLTLNNDMIKAILAHELGHLHYKDTVHSNYGYLISTTGVLALKGFYFTARLFFLVAVIPIPLFNWVMVMMGYVFAFSGKILEFVLVVPLWLVNMFSSRQNEYRADRFAVELGAGKGLEEFFGLLTKLYGNIGFFEQFRSSHPKTSKRLKSIRKLMEKNQLAEKA